MRLLDLIAQGRSARVQADDGLELPGAHRFSEAIRNCPLRYVLSDELARCATQLAYAEGDRLSACLDLIHVPARSLWVEWPDGPRREALKAIPALEVNDGTPTRHSGALVTASANCRSGQLRTFWSTPDEQAYLSPIVTTFDLDRSPPQPPQPAFWRGDSVVQMQGEPALEELLEHLRFHLDDEWAAYYGARCHTEEGRATLLRRCLGVCAFDAPMLVAFFLLLGARDLLPREVISRERINRVRHQSGKPPLLEHIEVSAPLDRPPERGTTPTSGSIRSSPRLHHVRGHIVRRGAVVFWRSPHMRGSGRLGQVRSRTVVLTFGARIAA
ncbi:MAG TPA: hypothetical protein VK676_09575 [Steroidobacteraceae bacterium]|jgi:hypothetical protein|nr:hypothetical protein [Steroidobacteraceae bacterium]